MQGNITYISTLFPSRRSAYVSLNFVCCVHSSSVWCLLVECWIPLNSYLISFEYSQGKYLAFLAGMHTLGHIILLNLNSILITPRLYIYCFLESVGHGQWCVHICVSRHGIKCLSLCYDVSKCRGLLSVDVKLTFAITMTDVTLDKALTCRDLKIFRQPYKNNRCSHDAFKIANCQKILCM